MATKSRFVGVRLEPDQQRKVILLSLNTAEPGSMSAGLRWAIEQAPVRGDMRAQVATAGSQVQRDREVAG